LSPTNQWKSKLTSYSVNSKTWWKKYFLFNARKNTKNSLTDFKRLLTKTRIISRISPLYHSCSLSAKQSTSFCWETYWRRTSIVSKSYSPSFRLSLATLVFPILFLLASYSKILFSTLPALIMTFFRQRLKRVKRNRWTAQG
jgi:hypothetical protein